MDSLQDSNYILVMQNVGIHLRFCKILKQFLFCPSQNLYSHLQTTSVRYFWSSLLCDMDLCPL